MRVKSPACRPALFRPAASAAAASVRHSSAENSTDASELAAAGAKDGDGDGGEGGEGGEVEEWRWSAAAPRSSRPHGERRKRGSRSRSGSTTSTNRARMTAAPTDQHNTSRTLEASTDVTLPLLLRLLRPLLASASTS